ncbi:MAG: Gfo/Idh/MocA family oxidoreductase, partial [Armatimonadetes bacterium]|nr:Gfo/Idh/MocA family oxidoreductase [Armatimonadota bacterium]NIM23984.1 Gfo/Idh/MocA family oxidoreductase [Armatimonadota bacterium]NIM67834.1 Gfo/Idh/MocA family oxidoreductase [Armatimonadota bacterium]NIM76365.1 Gfo/Idh/MocA family oxidoreductase [Armatimonadota bacterium]NIN06064.1 Gfo/Idh/MocA family oxidoreductase [Armatimonadota bacterium]
MKKVRVGVVGTGFIAQEAHFPAYEKLEDVEVAAVADINLKRAKSVAEKFGIPKVFKDYRRLLALDEIDAVHICTPNALHKPITIAALKSGKHVLVEKPIAMNAAEARAMIEASKKAKRLLMVGLNCRFLAESKALKRAIDAGALGKIYYGEAVFLRRRGIPNWGVFTEKKASGGGPVLDLGVHVLDWALHLMGFPKPVAVSGLTYAEIGPHPHHAATAGYWNWNPKKFEVEDLAVGLVRFRNGASLCLKTSWAANIAKDEVKILLMGNKGGCQSKPLQISREEYGSLVDITPVDLPKAETYKEAIHQFAEAI